MSNSNYKQLIVAVINVLGLSIANILIDKVFVGTQRVENISPVIECFKYFKA